MSLKKKLKGCFIAVVSVVVLLIALVVFISSRSMSELEKSASYVTGSVVNLRSGPGTGFDVLAQLNRGAPLTVVRDSIGWVLVDPWTGDLEGQYWIHADLIGTKADVEESRQKDRERASALAAATSGSKPAQRATQPTTGGTRAINGTNWFGCLARSEFERISGYAAQRDEEAFTGALASAVLTGTVYIFSPGEEVFVTDTALFSGLVKVRPKGQTAEYWTNTEAVF